MNRILLISLCLLMAQNTFAAQQGITGSESEGSTGLNIEVPEKFNISGLQDFSFGSVNPPYEEMSIDHNICVYTNTPQGQYSVTIESSHGSGAQFFLEGDQNPNQKIEYQVYFNDSPTAGNTLAQNAIPLPQQTGANTQNATCAVGPLSANLKIVIPAASLNGKLAQTYSDTVTIIIQP